MIESRLTKLVAEMVRRANAPRVLDYASPDTPRSPLISEWLRDEVEYRGGFWCVGLRALGVTMFVTGTFVRPGLLGLLMALAGVILELMARTRRVWRDMEL